MKALFAIAIAAFVASAHAKATIQEEHPIDWYDCSQKADGNYEHPSDCTRFISCSGGIASQRDCANCNVDPVRCPVGRLVYSATSDACLWADETECRVGGGGDSGENGGGNSGENGGGDSGENGGGNSGENGGGNSGENGGGDSGEGGNPPQEGDACNPEECRNVGYCQSYLRCDKESGKWVREECGENLAWNPQNPNGTEQIHGGNCDNWENLSDEVERQYRTDPDCLACFWRALGDCNREYDYQPPNGSHRNVLRLSCADGLVFSQQKETCQRCQDVRRADGSACC